MALKVEIVGDGFQDIFHFLDSTENTHSYVQNKQMIVPGGSFRTQKVFRDLLRDNQTSIHPNVNGAILTNQEKNHLITESKIRNISWTGAELITPYSWDYVLATDFVIAIDYDKGGFRKCPCVDNEGINRRKGLLFDTKYYRFDHEYLKASDFKILRLNRNDPAFENCKSYEDWDFVIITNNEKPIEIIDVKNKTSTMIQPQTIENPIQTIGAGDVFTGIIGFYFAKVLSEDKKIQLLNVTKAVEFACFLMPFYIDVDTSYQVTFITNLSPKHRLKITEYLNQGE